MWRLRAYRADDDLFCLLIGIIEHAVVADPEAILGWVDALVLLGLAGLFFGVIDEVEFFSRVLSGGEINTIFTSDVGGKCKPSDLTITKTHAGSFLQNSTGNTYTITVHNDGPSATSGLVTMQDMLPSGLTATGFSGDVTVVIGTNAGGGTLSGPTTHAAVCYNFR